MNSVTSVDLIHWLMKALISVYISDIYIRYLHQSCTTNILPHDVSLADPDFQIRGGGGGSFGAVIQNLRKEGGGSLKKKFFSTLTASVLSKNKGRGGPLGPLPRNHHCV